MYHSYEYKAYNGKKECIWNIKDTIGKDIV